VVRESMESILRSCGSVRAGMTTDASKRVKELERETRGLRRANEISRKTSAFFAQANARERDYLPITLLLGQ
jgi:transposase-like protein